MPDLDPLPPPPRRPVLAPREGDFAALAARAGRRRRARRTRYATAGSAAVAVVALVVSAGAPGSDSLVADPASTPAASASASASASGSADPTPSTEPTPPGPGQPSATASAPAPGSPAPEPTDKPAPSPTATPPAPPVVHATLDRRDVAYAASDGGCETGSASYGAGWCFRTPPDMTVQAGEFTDYVMDACRLPSSGPATITFNNAEEIFLGVTRSDATLVYQWGNGTYDPGHHSITVGAERCARWTLTWDATDAKGRPIEPGDYGASIAVDGSFSTNPTQSVTAFSFALRITE